MQSPEFVLLAIIVTMLAGGIGAGIGYAAWRDIRRSRPNIMRELRRYHNE